MESDASVCKHAPVVKISTPSPVRQVNLLAQVVPRALQVFFHPEIGRLAKTQLIGLEHPLQRLYHAQHFGFQQFNGSAIEPLRHKIEHNEAEGIAINKATAQPALQPSRQREQENQSQNRPQYKDLPARNRPRRGERSQRRAKPFIGFNSAQPKIEIVAVFEANARLLMPGKFCGIVATLLGQLVEFFARQTDNAHR